MHHLLHLTYRTARKVVIGVVGGTVVAAGVVMLVTPGPAFLVIPAGLAILAVEFGFARRWLRILKDRSQALIQQRNSAPNQRDQSPHR